MQFFAQVVVDVAADPAERSAEAAGDCGDSVSGRKRRNWKWYGWF